MEAIQAKFTEFTNGTNWVKGEVGKYRFEAKLFDEGSIFGINDGRILKLGIWDESVRQEKQDFSAAVIVHYDHGWDIKPNKNSKPYFDAVYKLLEESPKRFKSREQNGQQ